MFSSRCSKLRVPGIGTTATDDLSAACRSHASATWAGVAFNLWAVSRTASMIARFAVCACPISRGMRRRSSAFSRVSAAPTRNPRPNGDEAMNAAPTAASAGTTECSTSRLHTDHSDWTAAIGCTAAARRSSSAVTSLNPRWFTIPCCTSSTMAPTVSSMGTVGSTRCRNNRSICSTSRRLRLSSTAGRTASGDAYTPGSPTRRPNFVAIRTSSRRPAMARPTRISLRPPP